MLKAKFPKDETHNAKNLSCEKETVARHEIIAYSKGEFANPVSVKVYMARKSDGASNVYASIWVKTKSAKFYAGHGKASGYGYHKESEAIACAIESAGITLIGDVYGREKTNKRARIGGVGDSAIREALHAITRAAGYRKFTLV
jgi:hypothetical protein